jgi:hypothetical protein
MPGALYNYINYGCGVQDFPVDRDGWSRRVDSSQSITPASSTVMERRTVNPPRATTEPRVKQSKFKETPENRAPRMRTHAEIKAARIKREQKKISAALTKKRTSRWGLTRGERLVVAQKAVNKKY